jgi:hypothetical protein
MNRPLALLIILLTCATVHAQKINELEKRNGFKDLKLGMPVDSVKGLKLKKEFKEKEEFDAKLYTVENPLYASIGEVAINKVELKAYKDQVYQIHVVADKDPRLMKALESIYGIAEYDIKRETYFWKGQTLILKFKALSRNQLELIYTSYLVLNQMKDDKGKKVQDIADDF